MKIVADQNIPFVAACFASIGDVQTCPGRQLTADQVADADILLVRSVTKVNKALLSGSRVKFVATATIGIEHVDTDCLAANGIGFASAPGSNANSVAEYVVAALLTLAQKHRLQLAGRSIGVVGVGNVGSRVAQKCAAMGMTVKLNDPPLARQTGDAKYRPLAELLDCDVITFHTPLTQDGPDKSFHLADASFFKAVKPGAFFLNTSRGGVHDTAALKNAIAEGKLGGVVLDVWEHEPAIDADLLGKVDLASPHIAGYSFDGKVAGLLMIYRAACGHFGRTPTHTEADFLPAPNVPEIVITAEQCARPVEEVIGDAVRQIYDIEGDDRTMRQMADLPDAERGHAFDRLRKEYPRRREFQNTIVRLPNRSAPHSLAEALSGIGFQVRKQQ